MKSYLIQHRYLWAMILCLLFMVACGNKADDLQPADRAAKPPEPIKSSVANPTVKPPLKPMPIFYVVDSYNSKTFGWTQEINTGIVKGLEKGGLKNGVNYRLINNTIDAFVNDTPEKMQAQARRILAHIEQSKPDLVFTTDDDALVWVGLQLDDVPVVFNGVNGNPHRYLSTSKIDTLEKPGHNITGVYQTTYYYQSLLLMKKLSPSARTFAVITDRSTSGLAMLSSLKTISPDSLPLQWKDTLQSDQFTQWQEKVNTWQDQVDVLFLFTANTVHDQHGELMPSEAVVNWIIDNSTIPETASWAYLVKNGALASATDDGGKQGEFSAALALKILGGADPADLPISTPPNGVPALNLARAKMLGITPPQELINLLIEDGIIFK